MVCTDPHDARWDGQHVLNLADASVWFPSLRELSLEGLPMSVLRCSGASLPRLR